jgi:dTDP-4-dehydrorhamnose 3,5-epimerase
MDDGVLGESCSTAGTIDAGGSVSVRARPITGVLELGCHRYDDARGTIAEIYRSDWIELIPPMQNFTLQRSAANVLRGMRLHRRHDELVVGGMGDTKIGLFDMRPASPTHLVADVVDIPDGSVTGVFIPAGVLHGIYSVTATVHVEARTTLWDPADENGCTWDAPGLRIPWNLSHPIVRRRDGDADGFAALLALMSACA